MANNKAKYWKSDEGLKLLTAWTLDGLSDVMIAEKVGVSRSTLSAWKKKHQEIAKALKFDEEAANRRKYEYWLTLDGLLLIAAWTRDGLTDEAVAEKIGISRSTLSEWKIKYSTIAEAMKKSKDVVDIEVENALYKNATGYFYTEQVPFKCKHSWYDERGKKVDEEHVEIAEVERWHAPEVTAQIFWLKNRKPAAKNQYDGWRDTKEIDMNEKRDMTIKFPEHAEWSE